MNERLNKMYELANKRPCNCGKPWIVSGYDDGKQVRGLMTCETCKKAYVIYLSQRGDALFMNSTKYDPA